jgi:hypothetical protein
MTQDTSQKLELDWLKTIGGALAAVSSAVLLSTLGAAGTLIGAALGSVIATVGGALYSQGLARSRDRLAQAQGLALRKVGIAQAEVRRASRHQGDDQAVDAHLAHADERLGEAQADLGGIADEPTTEPGWRERLALLPWKRISIIAAGLFAAAVLTITAFELVAGESVSSITGGTEGGGGPTITRIGGGSDDDTSRDEEQAPSDDNASPSDAPSSEPSSEPSDEASPTDQPTDQPTDEPTEEPSESTTPAPAAPTTPAPSLPEEPTTTP